MMRLCLVDELNNQRIPLGEYKFTDHVKAMETAKNRYKNLFRNLGSNNYRFEFERLPGAYRAPKKLVPIDTTGSLI